MSYNNYNANQRLANTGTGRFCGSSNQANPTRGTLGYGYTNGNPGCYGGPGPYASMSVPNSSVPQQQQRLCGRPPMSQQYSMRPGPCCKPGSRSSGNVQAMRSQVMSQYDGMNQQAVQASRSCTAAPNPYTPRPDAPIMVNVSAATLAAANNIPITPDRGEGSVQGNPNVKYVPLSWESILGKTGMNGMRVSMVPSNEPGNENRQLKISFGGNGGQQMGSQGETPLRVVSFQPVTAQNPAASGGSDANAMNFTVGGQLAAQNQKPSNNGGVQLGAGSYNSYNSCRGR